MGNTSLLAISTVTSEINFFTRLLRMRDKVTNLPMFTTLSVTLACAKCREDGKAADCPHMLHLVPRWQSGDRHIKLKTIMQDRPDLIESELSGLAFDSLQQVFRGPDLDIMFSQRPPDHEVNDAIHLFIDPAAGGPGSDYAILSVQRHKGLITVRAFPQHGLPHVQVVEEEDAPVHRLRPGIAPLLWWIASGRGVLSPEPLPERLSGRDLFHSFLRAIPAQLDRRHQSREHLPARFVA